MNPLSKKLMLKSTQLVALSSHFCIVKQGPIRSVWPRGPKYRIASWKYKLRGEIRKPLLKSLNNITHSIYSEAKK